MRALRILGVLAAIRLAAGGPMAAQDHPPSAPDPGCAADSAYRVLDFWVGDWEVTDQGGVREGTDLVEKVVGGCAVVERWRSADGSEGQSLFYYAPSARTWRQVWVTSRANVVGGLTEKRLIAVTADGGTRFQGELIGPSGATILDRTTLTPRPDGSVHQLIEISRDGGTSWRTTFDAIYRRRPP